MRKSFLTKAVVAVGVMVSAMALSSVCAFAAETTVATYNYGDATVPAAFGFEVKPGDTNSACGTTTVSKKNAEKYPSFTDGTTLAHNDSSADTSFWAYNTDSSATMSSSITTNSGKKAMLVTPTVTGYMKLYFINVGNTKDKSGAFKVFDAVKDTSNEGKYTYDSGKAKYNYDMAALTGNTNYEPYTVAVTENTPVVFYFNNTKCVLAKAILVESDEEQETPVTAEITKTNSNSKAACAKIEDKYYAIAVIQAADVENKEYNTVVLSSTAKSISTDKVYKSLKFPELDSTYTAGAFGGDSSQYVYCVEVKDATSVADVTAISVSLSADKLSA